jgi:pimeloyl-ACP methyl ester carboxylesterase
VDRPGYGHSTFQKRRQLLDWPNDVEALADHLGVEQFAVFGVSGGGPHSLVCAALLPDRVTRAGVVSGVGPLERPEELATMTKYYQLMAKLAKRSEVGALPFTSSMAQLSRRRPEQAMKAMLKQLPPADVALLQRPELKKLIIADAARASATSARAAAQDVAIFVRPWGFNLAQIAMPVDFWQGDADLTVPSSHAQLQASQIRGAELHEFAGEGHFMFVDHIEEILKTVSS